MAAFSMKSARNTKKKERKHVLAVSMPAKCRLMYSTISRLQEADSAKSSRAAN